MLVDAHEIHPAAVAAVPNVIRSLSNRGAQFLTVTEFVGPSGLVPGRVYRRDGAPR